MPVRALPAPAWTWRKPPNRTTSAMTRKMPVSWERGGGGGGGGGGEGGGGGGGGGDDSMPSQCD